MKKIALFIAYATLCMLLGISCKSKQQAATSLQPWLQEKTVTLNDKNSTITLYELDGKQYYGVFCQGPEKSYDMNRTVIYDAEGNQYLVLGGLRKKSEKEMQFFQNAENKGIIWQSDIAKPRAKAKQEKE